MEEFRRDLDKAKYEDSLKSIIQVLGKQTGIIPGVITEEKTVKFREKKALLEEDTDEDVDFDFQFSEAKTEQEVEERLGKLRTGLVLKREDDPTRNHDPQPVEPWDNPDEFYKIGGTRIYYNRRIFNDIANQRRGEGIHSIIHPQWTAIAQTYQVDITGEINAVIMLNDEIPDYESSFQSLKKLCVVRNYTESNMKDCLICIAAHFEGYHAENNF